MQEMQETQVWSLDWEDALQKGMETHSSILAWKIPWTEEPGRLQLSSVQFSRSVMSDSLQPHDCSMPGFPAHHQLPELAQTHLHRVGDAIRPSHSLSSPYPPAFNLSQHQGLSQWVSSSPQVAKVLEFQLQHQSFQWIFRTDFLWDWLVGSPCSLRDMQESSLQKHQKLESMRSQRVGHDWATEHKLSHAKIRHLPADPQNC